MAMFIFFALPRTKTTTTYPTQYTLLNTKTKKEVKTGELIAFMLRNRCNCILNYDARTIRHLSLFPHF